jgi:TrmH family RNA methyltransferase
MLPQRATMPSLARITSRKNPHVERAREVARGQVAGRLLLDGAHLVGDALDAGLDLDIVFIDAASADRREVSALANRLAASGIEVLAVAPTVMSAISPVRSSSAIVAIGRRPERQADALYAGDAPLVVIADTVQDPGNLGAIVRVAEAGGASGLVAAGAGADPYGWKALRGSMGSALRLPIVVSARGDAAARDAVHRGCRTVATVPRSGRSLYDADLRGPLALLVGGEGGGLAPAALEAATERISIPMADPVESLNAAVALALVVYEARRQRTR